MYISGDSSSNLVLSISATTHPVYVNWGDGSSNEVFNVGALTTLSHNYSTPFTGVITLNSINLSTINILSIETNIGGAVRTTISTTELAKATSCVSFTASELIYVTGNIANIPSSITSFIAFYCNTISGDIADLPQSLYNFAIFGNITVSGDIVNLPTTLNAFQVVDNVGGGIGNTIYGDIANLPGTLSIIRLFGNNTISGNIANLPSGLTLFMVMGNNTISGDLSSIPSGIIDFQVSGNTTISTYSTTRIWAPLQKNIIIGSSSPGFVFTELNQLLTDLGNTTWAISPPRKLTVDGISNPKYDTNNAGYLKLIAGTPGGGANTTVTVTIS